MDRNYRRCTSRYPIILVFQVWTFGCNRSSLQKGWQILSPTPQNLWEMTFCTTSKTTKTSKRPADLPETYHKNRVTLHQICSRSADGSIYSRWQIFKISNCRRDAIISNQQSSGRQDQELCVTIQSPRRNIDEQRSTVLRTSLLKLTKFWVIRYLISPPHYTRSNSFIERLVQQTKFTMGKKRHLVCSATD